MNANINFETDYNIGDMVYVISVVPMYNNWYRNETKWAVESEFEKYKPFEITKRVIEQYRNDFEVLYKIDGCLYKESEMFKDLDSALEECKRRNNKNER